ncbi:type II toxin-antitoxin system Phd/YefM family antitoxin [Methylovulum miyakonense]|uniref:type II toxin-antitoxin system Phd/YefM family antitoxin n=1 Tax=Methylovulum miyakonense TaxID=645578 RepID=UPI0003777F8E|nr:type II toxin-antitoxin system Phd/YefM family antitoxin [Methylovulum miyakonense]
MKTSTIAEAKNNLSQLIHQLELDEAIHLTRHGKPVAVMLSEANYQKLTSKNNSLYQAIQEWRSQRDTDGALTESELGNLRSASQEREFTWDE